ncbi:unnamed protein product [Protopolystoma xenopodis]|uniref:Uncharacterized protein n=1 Tax=Protopolystoma xenopodis TaxID=117903 RepID=A0A448WBY5_9PLAT|nr:unnamed protein product [Protopolystoma xenopodis]
MTSPSIGMPKNLSYYKSPQNSELIRQKGTGGSSSKPTESVDRRSGSITTGKGKMATGGKVNWDPDVDSANNRNERPEEAGHREGPSLLEVWKQGKADSREKYLGDPMGQASMADQANQLSSGDIIVLIFVLVCLVGLPLGLIMCCLSSRRRRFNRRRGKYFHHRQRQSQQDLRRQQCRFGTRTDREGATVRLTEEEEGRESGTESGSRRHTDAEALANDSVVMRPNSSKGAINPLISTNIYIAMTPNSDADPPSDTVNSLLRSPPAHSATVAPSLTEKYNSLRLAVAVSDSAKRRLRSLRQTASRSCCSWHEEVSKRDISISLNSSNKMSISRRICKGKRADRGIEEKMMAVAKPSSRLGCVSRGDEVAKSHDGAEPREEDRTAQAEKLRNSWKMARQECQQDTVAHSVRRVCSLKVVQSRRMTFGVQDTQNEADTETGVRAEATKAPIRRRSDCEIASCAVIPRKRALKRSPSMSSPQTLQKIVVTASSFEPLNKKPIKSHSNSQETFAVGQEEQGSPTCETSSDASKTPADPNSGKEKSSSLSSQPCFSVRPILIQSFHSLHRRFSRAPSSRSEDYRKEIRLSLATNPTGFTLANEFEGLGQSKKIQGPTHETWLDVRSNSKSEMKKKPDNEENDKGGAETKLETEEPCLRAKLKPRQARWREAYRQSLAIGVGYSDLGLPQPRRATANYRIHRSISIWSDAERSQLTNPGLMGSMSACALTTRNTSVATREGDTTMQSPSPSPSSLLQLQQMTVPCKTNTQRAESVPVERTNRPVTVVPAGSASTRHSTAMRTAPIAMMDTCARFSPWPIIAKRVTKSEAQSALPLDPTPPKIN